MVKKAIINHNKIKKHPDIQFNKKITPIVVAIPLPPLNLSHTGKQCPKIANNPERTEIFSEINWFKKIIGTIPFKISNNNVNKAANLLPVLKTFVAPIFPDPKFLKSMY